MDTFGRDLRYALRMLVRNRGFTAVAVLTLALGIGATTLIYSAVDALLLRAFPFPALERLLSVSQTDPESGSRSVSPASFTAWKEGAREFESLAAWEGWTANLSGAEGGERVRGFRVTPEFFRTLGIAPARGRTFAADAGTAPEVVISQALWKRTFASDPRIVGRTVVIDNQSREVIGVMPEGAAFPQGADVWAPLAFTPASAHDRTLRVIGRLRAGVTPERAQGSLATLSTRLAQQYPSEYRGAGAGVQSFYDARTASTRTFLQVLMGAVAFVLLIACGNVANLLLARATSREREMAIRSALGAGRRLIIRQLLTESVVLALAGGLLGLVLAYFGIEWFRKLMPAAVATSISGWDQMGLNPRVLACTVAVSLLAGVVFGLAPAFGAARPNLTSALKESARGASAGGKGGQLRQALVVSTVALALVLLVGAGLMVRTLTGLLVTDPGIRTASVLTMQILPAGSGTAPRAGFYDQALERVKAIQGVQKAGTISHLPLTQATLYTAFSVEGPVSAAPDKAADAMFHAISPEYPEVFRIPLVRGRLFSAADRAGGAPVALVSRALAERFWPGMDPVGRRLWMDDRAVEVVGEVGSVRHESLQDEPAPEIYVPQSQAEGGAAYLAVRASSDPWALAAAIRAEIASLDRGVAVSDVRTMDAVVQQLVAPQKMMVTLLSVFAVLSLLIAAVGLYGVMSYAVAQRRQELGIRMALGAEPLWVLRMILGQGLVLIGAGLAIGTLAAFALTRFMGGILYGVSATDPVTFLGTLAVLMLVGVVACFVPARRATASDPMLVLRS